ncbi:hypothetical protein [Paenibacillus odorifer]|uniref:hypothetical protein n=1 Tax=Paenibacillus odorifer TaxID=189426 RepID=UPI00096DD0DF|nr:hypothetical protein [Paenibacillus odorifer]OMD08377.1 hypothetical protein BJP50_07240 [Paenibacillus odorifer]
MTPERIEAYRKYAHLNNGIPLEDTIELLAALEEAEHKLGDTGNALEIKRMLLEKANYEAGRQRVFKESAERKMAEAQQTIARYKSALQIIRDNTDDQGAIDCVNEALGERAKES